MPSILKFRLFAFLAAVFVGAISLANLAAEFLHPAPLPFPSGNSNSPTTEQVSTTALAATIAPFRSDIVADHASALAGAALKSDAKTRPEKQNAAQNAIKNVLKIGPHDSRMWLALALVQAPADPATVESLKMSYLTGPNQAEIIPIRLDTATASNALSDAELGDLARSDVRALLSQLPGQRQALVNDYARASKVGKKFLEDSVATIDPEFGDKLRKK